VEAILTEAITQCPDCETTFKVSEAQLFIADGSVRCGACLHIFKAEEYFVSRLLDKTERLAIAAEYWSNFEGYACSAVAFREPEPPTYFDEIPGDDKAEITAVEVEAGVRELMEFYLDYLVTHPGVFLDLQSDVVIPIGIDVDGRKSQDFADVLYEEGLTYTEHWEVSDAEDAEEDSIVAPDFELPLHDDHGFLVLDWRFLFTGRSLKWLSGIALMIAVAIGQFAFFKMRVYAQMPEYRPTYVLVCRYLGCEVPEYENHDELRTRELVIRSHPRQPEALLVDVLLLNIGPFRQAFPGLRLQFYDVHGEVVASRVFRASEYLGGEMWGLKLMPSETEVRLSLELIDPGNDALGYQMQVVSL